MPTLIGARIASQFLLGSGKVTLALSLIVSLLSGCREANEDRLKKLEEEVKAVKQKQLLDDVRLQMEGGAYLTPGSDGYSVVETDLGKMTVALKDVTAYANGSRVALRFGNLTSATVDGAKTTISWGSVDEKGNPRIESIKSREISFSKTLRSGAWTTVSVVLEGVPPTELGFVRIASVGHAGISLLR